MTTSRKTGIILATTALTGYLGVASSFADELVPGQQAVPTEAVWPGSAAPRWGFPPIEASDSRSVRGPKSTEQQFAAFQDGTWPGAAESRWGYPYDAGQGVSIKAPSAEEQWAAVESGTWPGKAEARWGQAHLTGQDRARPDRQAVADSK